MTKKELAKSAHVANIRIAGGTATPEDLKARHVANIRAAGGFQPLPVKKYGVIYADPPWQYGSSTPPKDTGVRQAHYPTVSLADLKRLPVKNISDKNCLLYLWVTGPLLAEAIELGGVWGFKYRQVAFVWHKQNAVVGNYSMTSCEYVLVFKRGNRPLPRDQISLTPQFLQAKASRHSAKPLEIKRRIDEGWPGVAKIELFARPAKGQLLPDNSEGWDFWGNEVPTSV